MAIHYVDQEGGNDGNTGLSFAQRKKTISAVTTAAGDSVRVMASPAVTSLGINGTWTNLSRTLTLASALTANISDCESAWTASANVTQSASTTRKEGSFSQSLAIAAGFTTGKVAYVAMSATDFSGYQQVSFWIRTNVASLAAGVLQIVLCSDAVGDVPVDTLNTPLIAANGTWQAITIDNAAALGASIESVAIYAASDPGAVTVLIDNIIACKASASADSLSLRSLVSKNTAGETWYPIKSINGTTVIIDNNTNSGAGAGMGYYGTTETVTTYKREPVATAPATTQTANVAAASTAGTFSSNVTYSGGWNRTDMSTQTDVTWFDGQNGFGNGFEANNKVYQNIEKLNFVRYDKGFCNTGSSGGFCTFTDCAAIGCTTGGYNILSPRIRLIRGFLMNNGGYGARIDPNGYNAYLEDVVANNNLTSGIVPVLVGVLTGLRITAANNTGWGINNSRSVVRFNGFTSASNSTAGIWNGDPSQNFLVNASIGEATEVTTGTAGFNGMTYLHKLDATTDNHKIYTDGGLISSETGANRRTGSGMAWALSPTSTDRTATNPLVLSIAKIACVANTQVTVNVWVKRSNAAITAKIVAKGGFLTGIADDVSVTAAGSAGTYEELELTFTPTEAGVIEIEAHAYGGTTHTVYVDDMTISQA